MAGNKWIYHGRKRCSKDTGTLRVITIPEEVVAYAYRKTDIFKNFIFYKQLMTKCVTELVFNARSFLPCLWHFRCCPGDLSELCFLLLLLLITMSQPR